MEVKPHHRASTIQLLFWGVIACAILLLPFTSYALVRTYYDAPDLPTLAEEAQSIPPEKYDARYHETRCYQVLTIRNQHASQEQWEAPCACTANVAVLAEMEYDDLQQSFSSTISESGTEYLLYGFYPTSRLSPDAEASRVLLKDKYQALVRDLCWRPHGLEKFWTKTYTPRPIKRGPLLPVGAISIGASDAFSSLSF